MKNFVGIVVLCAAAGCASTTAQSGSTLAGPEEQKSLETYVRGIFAQMDRDDFSTLENSMCEQAVVFDADENGKPVTARGKADVTALLERYKQAFGGPGVSAQSTINRIDCRVDDGSYCTLEFDQSVTINGQAQAPMKLRATLIAKRHGDRWIWTHWHASLRELAGLMAAPPAPEPPAPTSSAASAPAPQAPAGPPPAPAAPAHQAHHKK